MDTCQALGERWIIGFPKSDNCQADCEKNSRVKKSNTKRLKTNGFREVEK